MGDDADGKQQHIDQKESLTPLETESGRRTPDIPEQRTATNQAAQRQQDADS
jgi:hypothetical protein